MKTLLILDTNYLCYRAFYTTGHLSFGGVGTGVLYGVLQTVNSLQTLFDAQTVIFAFDDGIDKRREIFSEYKGNRQKRNLTCEEKKTLTEFRRQVTALRDEVLPSLGYCNIFYQRGYEADDVMASVVQCCVDDGLAYIISADQDLWQLLDYNVHCYNPTTKKMTTVKTFRNQWQVSPSLWPYIKALAGDAGDNVPGIKGIGLKMAARWYAKDLDYGSVAYRKIVEGRDDVFARNLTLIKLPFPGIKRFELQNDAVTGDKKREVLKKLGFSVKPQGVRYRKK